MRAELIGVIDLRGGRAVHAIAGQRHLYGEVAADGIVAGDAWALAERYRRCGVTSLYLADLDAIVDSKDPDWRLAVAIAEATCAGRVYWDAGRCSLSIATAAAGLAPNLVCVIPTESFRSLDHWSEAIGNLLAEMGITRVAAGLDLEGDLVKTAAGSATDHHSRWCERAADLGVITVVVLDLRYVGGLSGIGTDGVCRSVKTHWPGVRMLSGGGVRSREDIARLVDAGCDGVLIASALHRDETSMHVCE